MPVDPLYRQYICELYNSGFDKQAEEVSKHHILNVGIGSLDMWPIIPSFVLSFSFKVVSLAFNIATVSIRLSFSFAHEL